MADLKAATNIDPNVWYHVTEGRVDNYTKPAFGSMLQATPNGDEFLAVWAANVGWYWQFQPVDGKPGRYAIRGKPSGVNQQLSVCWNATEVDADHTRLCLARSAGGDEQKWDVANWGNDTYRLINVKNGSGHYLDVHPGSPVFMSSNINTSVYQPAQHWLMTSFTPVNDGAFSTVFSDPPATTTSGASSSPQSSPGSHPDASGGLSTGAKAGIGIGAALGVIALAVVSFLLWRRRQRRGRASRPAELGSAYDASPSSENKSPPPGYASSHPPVAGISPSHPPQEMLHNPAPQEVPADVPHELDSMPLRDRPPPGR